MKIDGSGSPGTWATRAAQPADRETLTALASTAAADLTGPELVDAIVASEKALSLLAGLQMRLLAALAVPFVAGDPMRLAARLARKNCITGDDDPDNVRIFVDEAATCLAASEIAAALRISPVTSGIRVREANTMTTVLAPTLHTLEAGVLDRGKARIIAEHCQPLSPENTAELQDLLLPEAAELSTSELRERAGEAVIIVDPEGSEDRHRAAAARRDLTLRAQPDAMATLSAFLTADAAVKIFQISDLLATSTAGTPGDTRGIGARRIDALSDIADHLLTNGYLDLADFIGQPIPDSTIPNNAADSTETAADPEPETPDDLDDVPDAGQPGVPDDVDYDVPDAGQPGVPDDIDYDVPAGQPGVPDDIDYDVPAGQPGVPDDIDYDVPAGQPGVPDDIDCDVPAGQPGVSDGFEHRRSAAATPTGTHNPVNPVNPVTPAPAPVPAIPGQAASTSRSRRVLTRQGRRPHLSVTIGLNTLAGLNELPGKLAGFGAIPASLARAIAKSAGTITALITDPTTGIATDAGALTYRPTQKLRDQIAALLGTCQFPSCRQPVWRCDIDHREPFDHQHPENGGRTSKENAGPFCRRHHLIKHHADWQIRVSTEQFTLHWTSPTGHRYTTRPRPAAVPDIRNRTAHITHGGTAIAERLDTLTAFNNASTNGSPSGPTSTVEELTTALLLRHHLSQPEMCYEASETAWDKSTEDQPDSDRHDTDETAWAEPTDDPPNSERPDNAGRDHQIDDPDLPDEPPF